MGILVQDGLSPAELRARRLALGLPQAALGASLGVTPNTVARWERGEQRVANPERLSAALAGLERDARRLAKAQPRNVANAVDGRRWRAALDELERSEAVSLFLQRARGIQPAFSFTDENALAVVELCRRPVARGRTNRQIAEDLVIDLRTAESHVSNILGKLGLSSRTQLAAWAIDNKLRAPQASAGSDGTERLFT